MRLLITDPTRGALLLEPLSGAILPLDCPFARPCCPCASHELLFYGCQAQRDVACYSRQTLREVQRMPALPALCAMCVSPCGRFLYQLGEENDCVHTRLVATGELLFSCEQGVFPRDLRLHSSGRALLVAGGASGEATLLRAPELTQAAKLSVEGAVCAAAFWRGGLALLCAVEDGDIRTVLYITTSFAATPRELFRTDGQPGGLCVCADGVTALIGTLEGVLSLSLQTGQLLGRLSGCPLCGRIEMRRGHALLSAAANGQIALDGRTLYTAPESQACFV